MPIAPLIFAVTDIKLSKSDVADCHNKLIAEMGADCFIGPDDDRSLTLIPPEAYYLLPDDLPKAASIIQAHPVTPYYGPDYARGCWHELAAIIEYLRHRVPDARVWYGEDSCDVIAEATKSWLDDMWRYWALNGSRSYYGAKDRDIKT